MQHLHGPVPLPVPDSAAHAKASAQVSLGHSDTIGTSAAATSVGGLESIQPPAPNGRPDVRARTSPDRGPDRAHPVSAAPVHHTLAHNGEALVAAYFVGEDQGAITLAPGLDIGDLILV